MKKRNLKRKASLLMALSMICTLPQAMNAEAVVSNIVASQKNRTPVLTAKKMAAPEAIYAGKVEIFMSSSVSLTNEIKFDATLSSEAGYTNTQEIKAGKETNKISFSNLPDGNYTLTVTGTGFKTYTQNISVGQKLYSIQLTAGFNNGYDYEDGIHPGVIMFGDVNVDGEIDETDKNTLVDVIDGQEADPNHVVDMNNDTNTDLADLTIFSNSFENRNLNTEASIEVLMSPDIVTPSVSENTNVEGNLENVLTGEAPVTLGTADGAPISKENPLELEFDMTTYDEDGNEVANDDAIVDGITIGTGATTSVEEAEFGVTYIDAEGEEHTENVPLKKGVSFLLKESNAYAEIDSNGNIQVHFGVQVAVKKVSIKITQAHMTDVENGKTDLNNLAEISKVEFVNGMEDRIPEPASDKPEGVAGKAGSETFTVSWNKCMNITGYQVKIEKLNTNGTVAKTYKTIDTTQTSVSFAETIENDKIENYTKYRVYVQSTNGKWESGWSEPVEVQPLPNSRPDKPDGVKITTGYKTINISWKQQKDTTSYSVFYKVKGSDDPFTEVKTTGTSYSNDNVGHLTEYEAYVICHNEIGSSPESTHVAGTTIDISLADMPKYNVINRDENGVPGSAHIVSVTRNGGEMRDSAQDAGKTNTAWGVVDNDKYSHYRKDTWDDGGYNGLGSNGLVYTLDQDYTFDTIGLLTLANVDYTHVKCWNSKGEVVYNLSSGYYTSIAQAKTDKNGKRYYVLKFPEKITANKVQIGLCRNIASPITIAETYFYNIDELMEEVMNLYEDDLHTTLKDYVTKELLDELREQTNTPDQFGEINPNKDAILKEIDTAEKILDSQSLGKAITVHNGITTIDSDRGFSGLNAWQPLGVSAGVGEEITIYVGSNDRTKKTGDSTNLTLVATQYHSESSNLTLGGGINLKIGANTIKITDSNGLSDLENGGALYVQYNGTAGSNIKYSIRINGGSKVPMLDLYQVTDESERMARAVEYIKALDEYVPNIEALHNEVHKGSGNKNIDVDYKKETCILGASDIMLDTMMISLPAQQLLAGAGKGTVEQRATKLLNSMQAMEDMMYLFYQHKGLNSSAPDALNQIPKKHLNIRYQTMFTGAFMYASGNHIGIEWGSASGLVGGVPIQTTEDGKYVSGNYFGWGIAHEIGHNINQGAYAVAEITNNYFSQLAQAQDKNEGMRFQYQNIYNKVSSGTKGDCSNIATQIGVYWQLHLAYDKGMNFKTYFDYNEQLANLFYARVDTYARNVKSAPAPKGVELSIDGDSDQNLMRLACAAAEKNILEYFERWGKTPDAKTREYAEQFEKETRAIFYANDDSRVYALNGSGSVLDTEGSVNAIDNVSVKIGAAANKVDLKFTVADNIPASDVLGYEITRCVISGGKVEETPVGFSTGNTFTDTVAAMNNRAVFYKVTLIDQYLNRSAVFTTDMVKIEHDGSMDKTYWTIRTSDLEEKAVETDATEEMPCETTKSVPSEKAIDNKLDSVYNPLVKSDSAEIIIDFNQTLTTTGLKYTAGTGTSAGQYEIYVRTNGEWVLTAEGTFKGSETVYFANEENEYVSTYTATAVKLVLLNQQNQNISIAELDVLGVTGDNVDFRRTEGEQVNTVIGTLNKDYKFGTKENDVIPAGSLVFTGSYKGNPAYNVVILYDENGNVVGGFDEEGNLLSYQTILADVPEKGNIANVSDGSWIYWIEPDAMGDNFKMPEKVRVELYRVNNATSNEGQRLVSDSLFEKIPATLPEITFGK